MEIHNNNTNFKANRLISVTRYIDKPVQKSEKFDVYKLNDNDIPFIKKVFAFLEKRKNKLNGIQKQLHEQFQRILNSKAPFNTRNENLIYIGIKNDSYITGFINTQYQHNQNNCEHKITNFFMTENNTLTKDSFVYAVWKETPRGFITNNNRQSIPVRENLLQKIKYKYPNYNFCISGTKEEHDLEEVLDIK